MENAASGIEKEIRKNLTRNSKILAVCGGGNNGADGICTLRKLAKDYECYLLLVSDKLNEMTKFQLSIAKSCGIKIVDRIDEIDEYDCYIDAIFGSGLNRDLEPRIYEVINTINAKKGLKIAVDIPSGINKFGQINNIAFKADVAITMGALKLALFLDEAKDFVGKIKVVNLGVSRANFETQTNYFLLTKNDLKLPFREKKNSNKSDYGHLYIVCGEMKGAAEICAMSAVSIGAGLVSLVSNENIENLSPIIMQKSSFANAKTIVCGCGLGNHHLNLKELIDKNVVIDADLFYKDEILDLITKNENLVLTPHPKEFVSLLKICGIVDVSVTKLQKNRFEYAKLYSKNYDNVLVLKGANTIIAYKEKLYIMPCGDSRLSKAGSGDALAGIIGGLLAQNYTPLNAAINGVLAHALSIKKCRYNSYAITPFDIIEGIKCL
ncbi:carbohydrate kinase, YjeF-related protein [Campylobacter blaseri]|nr:carbohydrate kinase, YjeF-related protein [Campylobacter blaseri]